ncbi:TPA: solute carrier family 23 protein [Streptococcus agalactiae]
MTLNAKGESNQILVDKEVHSTNLLLDIDEKPELFQGLLLSFQHVFAMFGATILVPLILGMPVSVALFASGCGTLIYQVATKFKVPVYLGSSFAYITAMALAMKQMHGDISAAQTGILFVGLIYVVVATVIKFVGNSWVDKILPPIIIGPMIIVIGLGLANSAVTNAGFVAKGDWRKMLVAVVTFLIAAFIAIAFSFFGKFTALISTIPSAVLGGMAILLYGVIASNGLKVLIENRVNFAEVRNLIIASSMLVLGLGGAVLDLGALTLSGTALSAIVGIILNLILPKESMKS